MGRPEMGRRLWLRPSRGINAAPPRCLHPRRAVISLRPRSTAEAISSRSGSRPIGGRRDAEAAVALPGAELAPWSEHTVIRVVGAHRHPRAARPVVGASEPSRMLNPPEQQGAGSRVS